MRSFAAVAILSSSVVAFHDFLNGYVPETPECYLPLDVLFLQDTTQSFEDDLPNVIKQIPQMIATVNKYHPNSRFGVAEFKDKPYPPFGWDVDYCYRLAADMTSSSIQFTEAYAELYASGGNDLPESQYQACINAIQDPHTMWRNIGSGPEDVGAKVIIMSTDAVPHYEGDFESDLQPASWVPYPGHITNNLTFDCDDTRYPTYQQFAAAFASSVQTYLVILTPDTDESVVSTWQWINNDLLGQDPAFYQIISADSSDLLLGVLKALDSVTKTACPTTTMAPGSSETPSTTITNHGDPSPPSSETTSSPTTATAVDDVTTEPSSTTPGVCPTGDCSTTTCDPNAVVVKAVHQEVDVGIVYVNGTVSNTTFIN